MADPAKIRMYEYQSLSSANGPGLRAVIWVQGCLLGCSECFNPQTHAFDAGIMVLASDLFERLKTDLPEIQGVTISGGEPLYQIKPLTELCSLIRRHTALSTILFTGFTWDEVQALPHITDLLPNLDVVIAGRYQAQNRVASQLIGSSNKTFHFLTTRYSSADFLKIPQAEVFISPAGEIRLSGIDPLQW